MAIISNCDLSLCIASVCASIFSGGIKFRLGYHKGYHSGLGETESRLGEEDMVENPNTNGTRFQDIKGSPCQAVITSPGVGIETADPVHSNSHQSDDDTELVTSNSRIYTPQ